MRARGIVQPLLARWRNAVHLAEYADSVRTSAPFYGACCVVSAARFGSSPFGLRTFDRNADKAGAPSVLPGDSPARVTVVGVGGAGCNAIDNMIREDLQGVDFLVANTDAQVLARSLCANRVQLGADVTRGMGAGAVPDIGREAGAASARELLSHTAGSDMVFITAGLGGGTGTGAAPVLARVVRESGALTVGVVSLPFAFEGPRRMRVARSGLRNLADEVDSMIVVPNQGLLETRAIDRRTSFMHAFKAVDHVLYTAVRGVTDVVCMPGLINLDFADVRSVMERSGAALIGIGEGAGEDRARVAVERALENPLLSGPSGRAAGVEEGAQATGALISVVSAPDSVTLFEVDAIAEAVNSAEKVANDANIMYGATPDATMSPEALRVTVILTYGKDALAGLRETSAEASFRARTAAGSGASAERVRGWERFF